jgi:multisubunit Na+/H+ antiporter MnhE subunit
MSLFTEWGNTLENVFAHGWGLVLLAIATLIGGIAAIDYFSEEKLKQAIRKIRHRWVGQSNVNTASSESSLPMVQDLNPTPSIVLLYKHDKPLDESAAKVLESLLTQAGHPVFLDRQKQPDHLKTALQHAEAILILLTSDSSHSDKLESEVETACQIANDRAGRKPSIIPIRLQFAEEIPQTHLAQLLDNRPAIVWNDVQDTSQLRPELMSQLTRAPSEKPYGAIPMASKFYIKRPEDDKLHHAIASHDSVILIRGSRQVGKTSLLVRGLQMARDAGMQVWFTDLQSFGDTAFADIKTFYVTLAQDLANQAQVDGSLDLLWDTKFVPNKNFEDYLCKHLLPQITSPVLWAIDEADQLLRQPFSGDVFGLLRSWHNKRATGPDQPTSKITLLIAYATEYHLFIKEPLQSPFNVGNKLTLEDFTPAQVTELNQRYDSPLRPEELSNFHRLTGGHPYLSRSGLHEIVADHFTFPQFTHRALLSEDSIFIDHLRRLVTLLNLDPPLREAVRAILSRQLSLPETWQAVRRGQLSLRDALRIISRGQPSLDEIAFDRLRSGGILKGESRNEFQLRCELYESYLKKKLL